MADNLDLDQGWHIEVLLSNSSRLSRILPGRRESIPNKENILYKKKKYWSEELWRV